MRTLTLFFLSSLIAFAHIDESIDQNIQLYGAPLERKTPAPDCEYLKFKKGEFQIEAKFLRGTCVSISYAKVGKYGITGVLNEAEDEAILKENGGGKEWGPQRYVKGDDGGYSIFWHGNNGDDAVEFEGGSITITNPEAHQYEAAVDSSEKQSADSAAKKSTAGL